MENSSGVLKPTAANSGNVYHQLEQMMSAVKKEAGALDAMKAKIKDLEEVKNKRLPEFQRRLDESESVNDSLRKKIHESELLIDQLRNDMQHLNDIYNDERRRHGEAMQRIMLLEQEGENSKREMHMLGAELNKAGELKFHNHSLFMQVEQFRSKLAEEAENTQAAKRQVDQQVLKTEKVKADMTTHVLQMTDEIRNLKNELKTAEESKTALRQTSHLATEKLLRTVDRAVMSNEDYRVQINNLLVNSKSKDDSGRKYEQQLAQLKEELVKREAQVDSNNVRIQTLEDSRAKDKQVFKEKMNESNEIMSKLRLHIDSLEIDISDMRSQMTHVTMEKTNYSNEMETIKKQIMSAELHKSQKELEIQREIQAISLQRDDAVRRSQDTVVQFDALHAQIRDMQDRHWQDLQKQKEVENTLNEDIDRLSKELDEVTNKLLSSETDKAKIEEYIKLEVGNAGKMVSTLRSELEKRLDELSSARKEKDAAVLEKENVLTKQQEIEKKYKMIEENFQKTLESDRQKLRQEVRVKMNRLNTLESEKQELLGETSQLMSQLTDAKTMSNSIQKELDESKKSVTALQGEIHALKVLNLKGSDELKLILSRENSTKDQYTKMEAQFKEDIAKLDDLIKQSKKTAAQQVADISSHSRNAQEELDSVKKLNIVLQETEKRVNSELFSLKTEFEFAIRSHDDMQQKISREVANYKREIQDQKSKLQLMHDTKNRMEMEIMAVRVEFTKIENELQHYRDVVCKDLEHKCYQASEQVKQLSVALETSYSDNRKQKIVMVDLEENLELKSSSLEKLNKECNRIKREETTESKKLKLLLNSNEQKLAESATVITMLQKELNDHQASYHKLQTTSNQTIGGLLEELRNTEDILSNERKQYQYDSESSHIRINELQTTLGRTKESFEKTFIKSEQDRSDKDVRQQQLEQELDRLRLSINNKDNRISELEKLRQEDRHKMHEIREHMNNNERLLADNKTSLELEQSQRQRLEGKVIQLEQELARGMGNHADRVEYRSHGNGADIMTASSGYTNIGSPSKYGTTAAYTDPRYETTSDIDADNNEYIDEEEVTAAEGYNSKTLSSQLAFASYLSGNYASNEPMDGNTSNLSPAKERVSAKLTNKLRLEIGNNSQTSKLAGSASEGVLGVEDSILRTQQFLQRKMNGGSAANVNSGSIDAVRPNRVAAVDPGSHIDTEDPHTGVQYGYGGGKFRYENNEYDDYKRYKDQLSSALPNVSMNSNPSVVLTVPKLRPSSPPALQSIEKRSSKKKSTKLDIPSDPLPNINSHLQSDLPMIQSESNNSSRGSNRSNSGKRRK